MTPLASNAVLMALMASDWASRKSVCFENATQNRIMKLIDESPNSV